MSPATRSVPRAWRKALRVEAAQALRRRDLRVTALVLLAASLLYTLLVATLLESAATPDAIALLTGGEATGFAVAFQGAKTMLRLLALLLLLWSAASVAGELEQGTHRAVLLRLPRTQWMLGKATHLALLAAGLSLGVVALALVAGSLRLGLEPVQAGPVVLWSTGDLLVTALSAWALALPTLLALVALGLCLSSLVRSPQAATTAAFFTAAALWVLGLLPGGGSWSFLGGADWPWQVAINHAEGLKTLSFTDGLAAHLGVTLGWAALLLAVAAFSLRRRDLP